MLKEAIKRYDDKAFTHNYIIVVKHWKRTEALYVDFNSVKPFIVLDGEQLRLNLTAYAIKQLRMRAWTVEPLGDDTAIDRKREEISKRYGKTYNKGHACEALVTEAHGGTWKADTLKYTDGPDVWIDGTPYQVKSHRATFSKLKELGLR